MTDWDKIWDEQGGARGGVPEPSFVRFANRTFAGRKLQYTRFLDIGSGTGLIPYGWSSAAPVW